MSITRGHACISLSRIGLFSGSVFNLSIAQAAIMPEPAVEFNLNKAFGTTIAIQMIPEPVTITILSIGLFASMRREKINSRWRKLTSCTYQEERRYEGRIQ